MRSVLHAHPLSRKKNVREGGVRTHKAVKTPGTYQEGFATHIAFLHSARLVPLSISGTSLIDCKREKGRWCYCEQGLHEENLSIKDSTFSLNLPPLPKAFKVKAAVYKLHSPLKSILQFTCSSWQAHYNALSIFGNWGGYTIVLCCLSC